MAYLRGAGRPADSAKAAEWLGKAAAQGHEMATQALASAMALKVLGMRAT